MIYVIKRRRGVLQDGLSGLLYCRCNVQLDKIEIGGYKYKTWQESFVWLAGPPPLKLWRTSFPLALLGYGWLAIRSSTSSSEGWWANLNLLIITFFGFDCGKRGPKRAA